MGFQKNKSKRKDTSKTHKVDKFQNKCDKKPQGNADSKVSNDAVSENTLSSLFRVDELQELRKILKMKDLSSLPFLLGAVVLEKFDVVKKLIKQGYNVNQVFDNTTALMWAVRTKNVEMSDLLVSRNADVAVIDTNGDNILFMAINSPMWDENTFMDFWNKMRKTHDININYTNKNNLTMLHLAVKRQWKLLVDALIDEKVKVDISNCKGVTPLIMAAARNDSNLVNILMCAGANVLHEDQRGCTPICFVIGNIIQKKLGPPYKTLDELTKYFKISGVLSYESYLQRRLNLIVNPPNNNIVAYQHVINKIIVSIIRFIMINLPSGVEILLRFKIFSKLKQAIEKHLNYLEYVHAVLSVIAMVLRSGKCYCLGAMETAIDDCEIDNAFINSGAADTCTMCLALHMDSSFFKQLLPQGLLPIFLACGGESIIARQWLQIHLKQMEPLYQKFLDICLVNFNIKEDENHVLLVKQRLKTFKAIYDELKSNNKDSSCQKAKLTLNSTATNNVPKQIEISNPGKKQAKRVRRKNRARIAKMRSADVVDRRRINSSVPLISKEFVEDNSSSTVIKEVEVTDKETETINDNEEPSFTDTTVSDSNITDSNATDSNSNCKICSENILNSKEIIEIIVNNPVEAESSESIEVLQEEMSRMINKPDLLSNDSFENVNMRNSDSSYQSVDSGILLQHELLNLEDSENNVNYHIDNNTSANRNAAFKALMIKLRLLLNGIITEYEEHWSRDRASNHPGYISGDYGDATPHPLLQGTREEQIHYLNGLLPYIEQQKLAQLIESFDKVIKKVEELFHNDDSSYKNIVVRLKSVLIKHNVRGNPHFLNFSNENEEPFYAEDQKNTFGAIGEHLIRPIVPTYMELIENVLPDMYDQKYINQDEMYLNELLAIPQHRTNLSRNEIEEIERKTEDHAYHLLNSATKICDSDTSVNLNHKNEHKLKKEKIKDQSKPPDENMPLIIRPNRYSDVKVDVPIRSKSTSDVNNKTPKELPRISRWAETIKNLQNFLRRKSQNKEKANDARMLVCPMEIRPHIIIATGGSFGDLELAFDRTGSAAALKRIQYKHINVCRMIMFYIKPLLAIRHKYLLRYISCERDSEGNITISTPLCEYNLGEYLMYLKVHESRPLALDQNIEISCLIYQMLNGLRFLHEQDKPIVHGNLKPSNILIDLNGRLRLAEFGISRTLYRNRSAPKSSIIWFARETYENYEQYLSMDCTKSSDIQVAGMLTHFILTLGHHPFGVIADDILHNIIQGTPVLQNCQCEIGDLISWMLLYEASERPTIRQVLKHIYFWDESKKWNFLLACTGITHTGVSISNFPIENFYTELDAYAQSHQIEVDWMSVMRKQCPDVILPLSDMEICGKETPTSFLRFMRKYVEQKIYQDEHIDLQSFFLRAFPALPLLLFVHVESTEWLLNPVFMRFLDVCK